MNGSLGATLLAVVLSLVPVLAWEGSVTDKERTKESAILFTGIVLSANFLQKLKCGALYSAQIQVASIEEWQPGLNKTNTVVYFEKTYSAYDNEGGFQCHGRVCPAYPDIEIGKKIKVWCVRHTVGGYTNVFFVPTRSSVQSGL
jgi:hypothetical protein